MLCLFILGKQIVDKYLRLEKGENNESSYREWLKEYRNKNNELFALIDKDDTFYSVLGGKITDILKFSDLIDLRLSNISRNEKRLDFVILDDNLLRLSKHHVVKVSPLKLPMIVPPKDYDKSHLGGYLLNDISYADDMFSTKKNYKEASQIDKDNKLFYLLNNVGKIPFKVNKEVLMFILSSKGRHLLINQSYMDKFKKVEGLSKYMQQKQTSLQSKFILQEFILNIATLFKEFNSIYFPVKLDHRGRVYCIPPYFNYQSSDLAKSLILFSKPGILNKNNLEAVKYLKAYGVNCFGGEVSKGSLEAKER